GAVRPRRGAPRWYARRTSPVRRSCPCPAAPSAVTTVPPPASGRSAAAPGARHASATASGGPVTATGTGATVSAGADSVARSGLDHQTINPAARTATPISATAARSPRVRRSGRGTGGRQSAAAEPEPDPAPAPPPEPRRRRRRRREDCPAEVGPVPAFPSAGSAEPRAGLSPAGRAPLAALSPPLRDPRVRRR